MASIGIIFSVRIDSWRHWCFWTGTPRPFQIVNLLILFASHYKTFLRIILNDVSQISGLLKRTVKMHFFLIVWLRRLVQLIDWLHVGHISCWLVQTTLSLLESIFVIQTDLTRSPFSCSKPIFVSILVFLNLRVHLLLYLFGEFNRILQFDTQFIVLYFLSISFSQFFWW